MRFDRAARERGVRRVRLLPEAIEAYLKQIEAERIEDGMHEYVEVLAAGSGDFVGETGRHTVERLLRDTEW